jgi:ATP-binding cassette subfamily B protein
LATLKRILTFWRPHPWLGSGLVVAMLLRSLFTVLVAMSVKVIIDGLTGAAETSAVSVIMLLGAGFVVSAAGGVAAAYLSARAGAEILGEVRAAMFDRLQIVSLGFHDRADAGDLLARFSSDVGRLADGVVHRPLAGLMSLVSIVVYVPLMFVLEARLAIGALLLMPLVLFLSNRMAPESRADLDEEKERIGNVLGAVGENLGAQATIRAFRLGGWSRRRFLDRLDALRSTSVRAEYRVGLLAVITRFGVAFAQLVLVGAGAVLALRGSIEAGAFAAFVALLTEFTWEVTAIGSEVVPAITRAASGIRRVDALLEVGSVGDVEGEGLPLARIGDGIAVRDVGFSYSGGRRQLDGVSLDIRAGRRTAIVGHSGSGKSTLLRVLLGFATPAEGLVTVDGRDLTEIEPSDYLGLIGTVFQDTFLFDASLRDNIALGDRGASEEDVLRVLDLVGLARLVEDLPHGLDTLLGAGGHRVSGGQRQLIGLARALVGDPAVLVLDEVTAALDPGSESRVVDAVRRVAAGRTVIAVTHRLQTVTDADHIVVLDDGRVVEDGSFEQLRSAGGAFERMWETQHGFRVGDDGRTASVTPERLAQIPVLSGLDAEALRRLAAGFRSDYFEAGQTVFHVGDAGDRFHIVVRGLVDVFRPDGEGEKVVNQLEDGEFFGELALLEDAPRSATVRAAVPTTTLSLSRRRFLAFIEESDGAAADVRRIAAMRRERDRE